MATRKIASASIFPLSPPEIQPLPPPADQIIVIGVAEDAILTATGVKGVATGFCMNFIMSADIEPRPDINWSPDGKSRFTP